MRSREGGPMADFDRGRLPLIGARVTAASRAELRRAAASTSTRGHTSLSTTSQPSDQLPIRRPDIPFQPFSFYFSRASHRLFRKLDSRRPATAQPALSALPPTRRPPLPSLVSPSLPHPMVHNVPTTDDRFPTGPGFAHLFIGHGAARPVEEKRQMERRRSLAKRGASRHAPSASPIGVTCGSGPAGSPSTAASFFSCACWGMVALRRTSHD